MNRQEAVNEYRQARRRGMSQYREDIREGKYPYPAVLEELLEESSVAGRVELGLVEIPMSGITGITTSGRQRAFSTGFMPLLEPDTEFADKWVTLCEAHLGSEGIRDPVRCFEYLGHFYVQEGNKRVSVLKFLMHQWSRLRCCAFCLNGRIRRRCGNIMSFCPFISAAVCTYSGWKSPVLMKSFRPLWALKRNMSGPRRSRDR